MMRRTQIDRAALPQSLLAVAKNHMRIEFDRDDPYLLATIARAIDFFERTTGMAVFASSWDWVPAANGLTIDGRFGYPVPFQPAPAFQVFDDADPPNDISTDYEMWVAGGNPDAFAPALFVVKAGAPATPPTVKISAGFADATVLPPGITNFVLEATAWFYENREIAAMPGADGVPYLNQLLTSFWVPRV